MRSKFDSWREHKAIPTFESFLNRGIISVNQRISFAIENSLKVDKIINMEQKQHNRFFLWLLSALVIGGAIFGMVQLAKAPSVAENDVTVSVAPITERDIVKGNRDASVVLVEYSDLQCPACASYYPLVKQLVAEFENDVAFVYRHFPLRQIHLNAQLAGQATEAAGKQDKFWEMHDVIFDEQKNWSNLANKQAEESFISYASSIGVDIEQFKIDMSSEEVKNKVNNDYQSGIQANVNYTPTFFLNGAKIQNPRSYEEFKIIIEQSINDNS